MKIKEENNKLIHFWNQAFEETKPMTLKPENFDLSIDFNRLLKFIGDHCEDVLDIGCGSGYGLFAAKLLGSKMTYGLGLDPSEYATDIVEATCDQSEIDGIHTKTGTHESLTLYDDDSFDGIICSNTLDVIPKETSKAIIAQIKRVIKPEGLLLLKFNFYLTDELIEKINMKKIADQTYAINGILRGVNHTTESWLSQFDGFELIEQTEFARVPNGPKDRVLLLKRAF